MRFLSTVGGRKETIKLGTNISAVNEKIHEIEGKAGAYQ